jgi:hypothetical protein
VAAVAVERPRHIWQALAVLLYMAATAELGFMERVLRQAAPHRAGRADRWVIQARAKVALAPVAN